MKNEFLSKVFKWLALGLLVTFLTAFYTSTNLTLLKAIFDGIGYIIIIVAELAIAVFLSIRIRKMSTTTATICYFGYSILTGLTLSSIFIVYNITSIIYVLLATSLTLYLFSLIGKSDKIDLSKSGTYLFIGLIALIIIEIINIFIMNNILNMVACFLGLAIFVGYIAYDIRKITKYYEETDNMAIMGAFQLYLDFINIFIRLLELFGKPNNK